MSATVSIGIPVYNGERFVADSIRSILAQDHQDLDIVIADNASTDSTLDICRDLTSGDERVRILTSDENRGAAWNYNRVLEAARAPFFKWAAADDICLPGFVGRCLDALVEGGPDVHIAFPKSVLIDEQGATGEPIDDAHLALLAAAPSERVRRLLTNRFEWHPVFGVMRTDAVKATRWMGAYVYADVVFLVEMAMGGRVVQLDEMLFLRRYHPYRPLNHSTFKTQAAWFDTRTGAKPVLPQARLARELSSVILRSELPLAERARCLTAASRSWILPHWRHIGGEVKLAGRELVAARRSPRTA